MAALDDLREYLGPDGGRWSDDALTGVLATEQAAQGRKCRVPADVTTEPDLYEARLRRCVVNLARRALPLGLTDAGGETGARQYVPGNDPEVRRLEAPFRKLPVG